MNSPQIHDLLALVAKGDQSAFTSLFYQYKDRAYSIAMRYTNDSISAEEIVQDVFVRVWKNREKLPSLEQFEAWLHTVTRNRSLSALKKIAVEGRRKEELINWLPSSEASSVEMSSQQRLQELLSGALSRLTPQQRKVFELSRLSGKKREEIADQLNLSPATVSVHLTIAIRTVRAFLSSHLELVLLGLIQAIMIQL